MPEATSRGPIVIYDGNCPLCNRSIVFILRYENEPTLRFASQSSPAGVRLLEQAGLGEQRGRSVVLLEGNKAYLHSTAALRIMRYLRRPWKWLAWLLVVPRPIRDPIYRTISRHRHKLGRPIVPPQPPEEIEPQRFIQE